MSTKQQLFIWRMVWREAGRLSRGNEARRVTLASTILARLGYRFVVA